MNASSNDDAESVNAFLERIAKLKDIRNPEDEDRTRKLEEDILQGRRERQARRERARSISPPKSAQPALSSPLLYPLFSGSSPENTAKPPVSLSPTPQFHSTVHTAQFEDTKNVLSDNTPRPLPLSPTKSSSPMTTATALSRSGTLSWQQRPSSRGSNSPRSRPVSRDTDGTNAAATDQINTGLTRDQITSSLSRKDPSWFRQTADRGANSYAYVKGGEENFLDHEQNSRRVPDMNRDSMVETEKVQVPASSKEKSGPTSYFSSAPDTNSREDRLSGMASPSTLSGHRSSVGAKGSRKFGALTEGLEIEHLESKSTEISSSQVPLLRSRSTSPTKGLGGFVQSAMMKRSDSVNKRWSAQAAPGLSRGNSVASHRGAFGYPSSTMLGSGSPPREQTAPSLGPPSSPSSKSRPTSSHSTSTALIRGDPTTHFPLPPNLSSEPISTPSESTLAKDASMLGKTSEDKELKSTSPVSQPAEALPTSPTKTMDPKRWSPTKASWLEIALARPDSPKLTSPKLQTPSWMTDLQKSKLFKEEFDSVKSPGSSSTMFSPTELVSPSPLGTQTRPLPAGGLFEGFHSDPIRTASPEKSRHVITERSPPSQNNTFTPSHPLPTSPTGPSARSIECPETRVVVGPEEKEGSPKAGSTFDAKAQPPLKVKLQTPTRTDFRANLKPPQTILDESSSREPEFKNVFSKLKRTETKNYIAPDELRNNILRGKAALNLTRGPPKKESMKPGEGVVQRNVSDGGRGDPAVQKSESVKLPEALAKRKMLNKSSESTKSTQSDATMDGGSKDSVSSSIRASTRSVPFFQDQSLPTHRAARPIEAGSEIYTVQQTADSTEKALSNTEGQVLPSHKPEGRADNQAQTTPHVSVKKPQPIITGTSETNKDNRPLDRLANRVNPDLSKLLSRGPTFLTRSTKSFENAPPRNDPQPHLRPQQSEDCSVSHLTHLTKARPRGPKRRLPMENSYSDQLQMTSSKPMDIEIRDKQAQKVCLGGSNQCLPSEDVPYSDSNQHANVASHPHDGLTQNNDNDNAPGAARKANLLGLQDPNTHEVGREQMSKTEYKVKTKPVVASKSPTLRKISSSSISRGATLPVEADQTQLAPPEKISSRTLFHSGTAQEEVRKTAAGISPPMATVQTQSSARTVSNLPGKSADDLQGDLLKSRPDAEANDLSASVPKATVRGLGLQLSPQKGQPSAPQLTPPPEEGSNETLNSLDTSAQPQGMDGSKTQDPVALQQRHPEVVDFFTEFFDAKPKITDKAAVDAQAIILNRKRPDDKHKVLKTQIWQINPDGKKENLPPHQGHILFEDCMYLCVHSFKALSGSAATEVYLWGGDGVSEAAVEDAQLFCRREARENNARFELVRQGKEPAKFFQALGGIVITRRSKTSSLYMLCGRRHLGHIAFDEVDLDSARLCSGFPFIISARFGKLYLWKGKASGADEIGCARLIAMDLGLTGEVEEVEEGEEPLNLLESFSHSINRSVPSRKWSFRSSFDRYECRLFRVELEPSKGMSGFWTRRGSSPAKGTKANIQEIHPFCQRDLEPGCVFVLDAYFNTFVYVGVDARSKSADFVTALIFSQDYGILAASLEDRPFVPSCEVVFYDDAPPEFTAAFRKWEHRPGFKSHQHKAGHIIALSNALEGLSSERGPK